MLLLISEKIQSRQINQMNIPVIEMKDIGVRESCGGHFREEHVTEDGEAKRDDKNYAYVAAWEYTGKPSEAIMHKEELEFKDIELKTRSYK